jgi:hypothetical protein
MSPAAYSDATVMGSLTQKIARILTAPDKVNRVGRVDPGGPGREAGAGPPFLAFAAPGIPIGRGDLGSGDMADTFGMAGGDAHAAFSRMVNSIPSAQRFWVPTARKTWDVYEDAITQVTLPVTRLSARQQAELDDALAFLARPAAKAAPAGPSGSSARGPAQPHAVEDTPELAAYKQCQTAYLAALATCNGMEIQANCLGASNSLVQDWARNGAAYESQLTGAYEAWVADGHKADVEEAVRVVRTLAARGPEPLYRRLRATFAAGRMTDALGRDFLPTFAHPADPLATALKASWSPFEFTLQDVHAFEPDGRISSGGSAGPGWGLWSASALREQGQHWARERTFPCDTTGLMVQAELLQVPLTRPWMRPEIFSSRAWRWAPSAELGPVSDGGTPPVGLLPLIPAAMVLAQNVTVHLDMTTEPNVSSWSSVSPAASIGWGPFTIQGNLWAGRARLGHVGAGAEAHFTQSTGGISVPGPQIVAFVCDVLGRSPDPDPALEWPAA